MLQLQRSLGNQAVGRLLEHQRQVPLAVQRKIGITSSQLAATQNRKEKLKGAFGAGTFAHLLKALKNYETSKDPATEQAIVATIYGLAKHWLDKYGEKGQSAQKAVIEDVEAEAMTERGACRRWRSISRT